MLAEALVELLETASLTNITVVVFDLDMCLGPYPGWDHAHQRLDQYVDRPHEIRNTVNALKKRGITCVLISRNLGFCDPYFEASAKQVWDVLGMRSARNARIRNIPKTMMINAHPSTVLLIDDTEKECTMAKSVGSVAFHVEYPMMDRIYHLDFKVHAGQRDVI